MGGDKINMDGQYMKTSKASQRYEGSNCNRRDEMMPKDTPSKWHEKKSEQSTIEKQKHMFKKERDQ